MFLPRRKRRSTNYRKISFEKFVTRDNYLKTILSREKKLKKIEKMKIHRRRIMTGTSEWTYG